MKIATPLLTVALSALPSIVTAYDPSSRNCNGHICLTSFIWCSEDGRDCSYPEQASPYEDTSYSGPEALLRKDAKYTITWKNNDPNFPVYVAWLGLTVIWETNVTAGATQLDFLPNQILMQSYLRNGSAPVQAMTQTTDIYSRIWISQPAKDGTKGLPDRVQSNVLTSDATSSGIADVSSKFWLISQEAQQWANQRIVALEKKWKMGVGIGVGLGVPILLALVWFATRAGERRKVRRGVTVETKRPSTAT